MKIGLVSSYTRPYALGLRYISSSLKAAGHDVVMIFMNAKHERSQSLFSQPLLDDLADRLRDCGLIGVSLMANSFLRACALTRGLRDAGLSAPIIWGGVHPTVAPDECLKIADAVCLGEGETPMLELAASLQAGRDPTHIAGLQFRAGSVFGNIETIRNAVGPLNERLDGLPFPDYELETHWVAERDKLAPAKPENLHGMLETFLMIASRGCPHHCTFCTNTALRNVHEGAGRWVRLRSLDNVLAEMRQAVACFPTIRAFHIVDDLFFVHSDQDVEAFVDKYKVQIGLPLLMEASPNTVTDRKVHALAQAPVKRIILGIQSASDDTLRTIYKRPMPPQCVEKALDILAKYKTPTELHYITSNPYEPEANTVETMRFVASHHRHAEVIHVFPLVFFPGTPLFDRARQDGSLDACHRLAYEHAGTHVTHFGRGDYLAIWLRIVLILRNVGVPGAVVHPLISLAIHPWVRKVLDRRWFGPTVLASYVVGRKVVRNLIYQPFIKPFRYLRHRPRRRRQDPPQRWKVSMAT